MLEVTGPDPASRRAKGKDDTLDAIAAAEAARTRRRVQVAKDRSGAVEALRVLRTTRKTAIKCRRAALQQLHNTIVAAPEEVRDQVRNLTRMVDLVDSRIHGGRLSRNHVPEEAMTNEAGPGNNSIDRLEGSLLATRSVLQILLEKGLPQIRFKGDLILIRDAAQELMESSLRHRSPTFVSGAQATIESLFKTITLEARD